MPSSTPAASLFLDAARLEVGFLQAFPVIDPHLGELVEFSCLRRRDSTVKPGERLERRRSTRRLGKLEALDELLVDLLLLGHPQAVGHLDDADDR